MEDQTTQGGQAPAATEEKPQKRGFSAAFMREIKLKPIFRPGDVHVAGDGSTSVGRELAGTYLDDGRACLPWSADHEGIAFGLLTGSSLARTEETRVDADGEPVPVLGEDGTQKHDAAGKPLWVVDKFEVLVSNGQPELAFLQGYADHAGADWFLVMQDGRQRRRAAMELQRRLDWCASLFSLLPEDQKGKPGRRNALLKLGKRWAKGVEALVEGGAAQPWAEMLADAGLPEGVKPYDSPDVGGSLAWLTDAFARVAVGDDKTLGDEQKRGAFFTAHADDAARLGVAVGAWLAHPVWLKLSVCGVNVDPQNPASMLDAVAAKEAQVPTPPSLFAEQVVRFLSARMNPSDPGSQPLYSPGAVAQKLGKSASTLDDYRLIHDLVGEIKALLDSGDMSINFAVATRDSAFVAHAKGQPRAVLPADKQRLVLAHLLAELGEESGGADKVRFRGPSAIALGKKLRDAALAGKLAAPGAEQDGDSPGEGGALTRPTKRGPATAAADRPTPVKRAKCAIDVAAFRAAHEQALAALPPREEAPEGDLAEALRVAKIDAQHDEMSLARAVTLVVTGAEPPAILERWPHVQRALLAAVVAAKEADAPKQSEESKILDLCSAAVEEMTDKGLDRPTVTSATMSGGQPGTEPQIAEANRRLGEWVAAFGADPEAKTIEEFVLGKIVAAERAADSKPAA